MDKTKQALRQKIRQQRRALTTHQQQQAAQQIIPLIFQIPLFLQARHIAFYLSYDGEIDSLPLLQASAEQGKHCYLPAIHPGKKPYLLFAPYRPGQRLIKNRYGILEPNLPWSQMCTPQELDIVFTPLVGFDAKGHRLGMGGGYYDHSFAFLRTQYICRQQRQAFGLSQHRQTAMAFMPTVHRPQLMGLAYQFQQIDQLAATNWDIPLHYVITEEQRINFCRY